jgi:pimeloyl-ACP methyl ester carboxylesterase
MRADTVTRERFELRRLACPHGEVAWREAGHGTPLVLLHGIGSGSASWDGQLDALSDSFRVIAWDAPGYGGSAPLAEPKPLAADYARVLADWLRRLEVAEPVVVGHSLGAIVAAAYAQLASPLALVLASPARGYATAPATTREARYRERLALVEQLGIDGIAEQRSARLCAPGARADAIAQVRANMARATPGGYAQAAHMLAHDDLPARLRGARVSAVLCGEHDTVTPPDACRRLAGDVGAPFVTLHGVGHACYVEDPAQFNRALLSCLPTSSGATHA